MSLAFSAKATTDPVVTRPIKGSSGEFVLNAESYAKDLKYFSLSPGIKNAVQNNSIVNLVGVGIEEQSNYYIRSSFSATVTLQITTYDKNEISTGTFTKAFTVNYDITAGAKYKSFDYATYSNAFAVRVKIIGIDGGNVNWPINKVLKVENQLTATRDYPFFCNLSLDGLNSVLSPANNELVASWTPPSLDINPGITEYDLEWAWVDEGALENFKNGTNYVQDLIFTNNATRVTISSSSYNIPLLYDDTGRIFIRIRPTQTTVYGKRTEGKWSWVANDPAQPLESSTPVNYAYYGHEDKLNWQASTSFAEEGKNKSVIQYFDGSLRSRQTVTKDNSSNTIVIAESFYDYQGRSVIQVLPAPTLKTAIGYIKNFNQAIGFNEYPKSVYDKLDIGTSICASPAKPFNTDFGTANYYSAKNQNLATDPQSKFIPDATATNPNEAYPFTETRLAPDGTIAFQGGVGITHQIGSNHETKYYSETPAQEELDALFGTDAGLASHYSKNIVKDANGQFSVSYIDMHGRTIATALAGEAPKNGDGSSMVESLDSKEEKPFTRQLIDKETNTVVGNSIISSKPFVVLKDNTTYAFDYSLSPKQLNLLSCTNQAVCYDCLYQLKFTISSDCDKLLVYIDSSLNFTLGQYINYCNNGNANQGFFKHFEATLNQGSYTVTKTLTLSSEAQAGYQAIYLQKDTCKKMVELYSQELTALQATSNCQVTCESCKTAMGNTLDGFIAKFAAEMNMPVATLSSLTIAQLTTSYQEALKNCDRICNTSDGLDLVRSIRDMMLQDVTPPYGQYARLNDYNQAPPLLYQGKTYNIFKVNDRSNSQTGYGVNWFLPDYLQPRQFSSDGQTWLSSGQYFDELNQSTALLQSTTPQQFTDILKTPWAAQLLVHHPEFKKLQLSETQLKPAFEFEALLEKDTTWTQAAAHNYITNLVNLDPFFTGAGAGYKAKMLAGNHLEPGQPSSSVNLDVDPSIHGIDRYVKLHTTQPCTVQYANAYSTMWQVAIGAVFCRDKADGPSCSLDYSDINTKAGCTMNPAYAQPQNGFSEGCATDRDWAWKVFKTLYLAERRKLIAAYLNANAPSFSPAYPNNGLPPYQQRFINHANPQAAFGNLGVGDAGSIGSIISAAGNNLSAGNGLAIQLAQQQYDTVCRGYANTWIAQLRACPQLDAVFNNTLTWEQDSTWLVSRLAAICKNGSDNGHSLGSSSVKPGNVAVVGGQSYTDFTQVIEEFLQAKGIANPTAECFSWLINTPKPYELQTPLANSYVVTKPSDCECQRIGDLKTEWTLSGFGGTFSAYLQYKHGTYISGQQLDALSALCNNTYQCKMLEKPIPLPPALQCPPNAAPSPAPKTCISCSDYQNLKSEFTSLTGQATPFANPQTDSEINFNNAFAAFVNHKTGFTKTWMDYLAFQNTCNASNPPISCTSLDSTLKAFYLTPEYLYNTTGLPCAQALENYFNSHYNVVYTYSQWMQLFTNCGTTPTVCKPQITCTIFENLIDGFYNQNGVQVFKNGNCKSLFVNYVNTQLISNYSYAQLDEIFQYTCKSSCALDICNFPNQFLLKRVVRDFKTAYPRPWNLGDCQGAFAAYFNQYFGLPLEAGSTPLTFWEIREKYFLSYIENGCIADISELCNPPYDCESLYVIWNEFLQKFEPIDQLPDCKASFAAFFNERLGTNYTYLQIASLYFEICKKPLSVCTTKMDCEEIIVFASHHMTEATSEEACHQQFLELFNSYFGTGYTAWDELYALYKECGYDLNTVCSSTVLVADCKELTIFVNEFKEKYPDPATQLGEKCRDYFAALFNERFHTQYSFDWIAAYYLRQCNTVLDVCSSTCTKLTDFITGFNSRYSGLRLPVSAKEDLFAFEYNKQFLNRSTDPATEATVKYGSGHEETVSYEEIRRRAEECGVVLNLNPSVEVSIYEPQVLLALKQVFFILHPNGLPDECHAAFQGWFNRVMRTQYEYKAIMDLYNSVCGNNAGYICEQAPEEGKEVSVYVDFMGSRSILQNLPPMLCGLNEPGGGPVVVDDNPCKDLPKIAFHFAQEKYELYVDSLRNVFDAAYRNLCLAAKDLESFTMSYRTSEYHYTLYYYDQAGNLVKTVPPAGVHKLGASDLVTVKQKRQNVLNGQPEAINQFPAAHTLATQYRYNTLNQVVVQSSPDGGASKFYYDRLGRLAVSQNAKQAANSDYSYTLYDELGRIKEVGQVANSSQMTQAICQNAGSATTSGSLANWLSNKPAVEITRTYYDKSYLDGQSTLCPQYICQANLRNRVSYTEVCASGTPGSVNEHTAATYYSYDMHGNVFELLQDYNSGIMKSTGHRFKKVAYAYDLVSGKVNTVAYQHGQVDAFYHRYSYDAVNRITDVETSTDKVYWERDARYSYYRHGPLSRTIIGNNQVQGLDYAYTLQGWLKGVNGTAAGNGAFDMGGDGLAGSANGWVAQDAFGFSLNYFGGDYKQIGSSSPNPFAALPLGSFPFDEKRTGNALYNGNIASMAVSIPKLGDARVYSYQYDQLNRLVAMDAFSGLNTASNSFTPVRMEAYRERVSYDGNGNILTYRRNGGAGALAMDDLTYQYPKDGSGNLINNRLRYVKDVVDGNFGEDIKSQSSLSLAQVQAERSGEQASDNYSYDAIGNLVKDGSTSITWNVYGKIASVTKGSVTTTYSYDASGNRISKLIGSKQTWYVRDASGNVMSVYVVDGAINSGSLTQSEISLYGSSRLGVYTINRNMVNPVAGTSFTRGQKAYELSNHLGNVLVTVSDKKIGVPCSNPNGCPTDADGNLPLDYYTADVVSATDYYPFGMQMPDRKFSTDSYRYGYNGKEKDKDINGNESAYDFGARVYDSRIGRWFAVDPMRKLAPDETPYRFGHDNPILYKDPDGKWEEDGHYWTVYALGIAMGLSKTNAQAVAAKAEYYDHHVGANNSMRLHISHNNPTLGKVFGIGTWADADLQKSWHGLTGGRQSDVLNDAIGNIMKGDLNQLHKVGDAWAHSYIDDNGERTMWGKTTNWVPGLGRITTEHAFGGGHGNENADNISKRPAEYSSYITSLVGIFNNEKFAYNSQVNNSKPDLAIFDYVQKNGGSKEAHIFLLQSYIGIKTGTTAINSENKSMIEKLKGYLNQQGIKYTESSTSREVSTGASPTTGIPNSQTITTYSINVIPEKKN